MAREIGKRIQCYVCAFKLSCTPDSDAYGADSIGLCLPVSLVIQKFLLEEISKPLRYNSPQFFGARAGSYHRLPVRQEAPVRKPESLEFRWLVGPTGILEEAEGREGGRHLLSITCSQAAGIAKGRPFEKRVRSGIGQEILAWRSGIRGGFAPKK